MIAEDNQKERANKVSKNSKAPKTIKLSTLIIGIAVTVGFVISFVGGMIFANNYNDTVEAKAVQLSAKHVGKQK